MLSISKSEMEKLYYHVERKFPLHCAYAQDGFLLQSILFYTCVPQSTATTSWIRWNLPTLSMISLTHWPLCYLSHNPLKVQNDKNKQRKVKTQYFRCPSILTMNAGINPWDFVTRLLALVIICHVTAKRGSLLWDFLSFHFGLLQPGFLYRQHVSQ